MSTNVSPESAATPSSARIESLYRMAVGLAAVAGAFSFLVCGMLVADYSRRLVQADSGARVVKDPLDYDAFQALKEQLGGRPRDAELKEQIRQMDRQLRAEYFRQRDFMAMGLYLLLGGLAVSMAAAKVAGTIRRRLPRPQPACCPQDTEGPLQAPARWAVAATGLLLAAMGAGLAIGFSTPLPRSAEELAALSGPVAPQPSPGGSPQGAQPAAAVNPTGKPATPATAAEFPSDEEVHKQWPRFRGPDGSGVSAYANVPTTWDGASGKNILWKTKVPLPGHNSAIVWGDRVFLCGADKDRREVYGFDAKTGKLLWTQPVAGPARPPAKPLELDEETNSGWSAPTMATDGRRVFVIFPVGELAAFDLTGKPLWKKSFGVPVNSYGHAASLAMYRNLLLVQIDQSDGRDGKSKLYALDAASGNTIWEAKREAPNSWSSPIVVSIGAQTQIITTSDPWAISYDPASGQEIWRAKCLRQDVGPSPVVRGNMVYTAGQSPQLSAIRAEGKGDITNQIAWFGEDGLPDTCSPLATGEYVLLLTSEGMMTCYEAREGKMLWEHDFEVSFKASPSLAGKNVYVISDEGKGWVVEPGPKECKRLAENNLGEGCTTSPAFQDGRIYLRGKEHLFAIGQQ